MGDPLVKLIGTLDANASTGWVRMPGNGKVTLSLEGDFDTATVEIEGSRTNAPGANDVLDLGADASFTEASAKTLNLAPGLWIRATMTSVGASSDVAIRAHSFHERQ